MSSNNCANTNALNKYMNKLEKQEADYEILLDDLDEYLCELNDTLVKIKKVVSNTEYETGFDFSDDIKELIKDEIVL